MAPPIRGAIVRRFAQIAFGIAVMVLCLFPVAGDWRWTMAWLLVALYAAGVTVTAAVLVPRNPELIAERSRSHRDAKGWDKPLAAVMALFGPMSIWLTAALDQRFGWSPGLPLPARAAGLAAAAVGYALVTWSMASNAFFSGHVRIQKERGHQVSAAGPYGYVRHPGYVGMLLMSLATPAILASRWAFIPAAATVAAGVLRTHLEDRTLRKELDGYEGYASRVRFRLVPGLW